MLHLGVSGGWKSFSWSPEPVLAGQTLLSLSSGVLTQQSWPPSACFARHERNMQTLQVYGPRRAAWARRVPFSLFWEKEIVGGFAPQ